MSGAARRGQRRGAGGIGRRGLVRDISRCSGWSVLWFDGVRCHRGVLLLSRLGGTTGRDGGRASWNAGQRACEVTFARPVGALPGTGARRLSRQARSRYIQRYGRPTMPERARSRSTVTPLRQKGMHPTSPIRSHPRSIGDTMNSPPFERLRGIDPDVLDAGELDVVTADIAACRSWLAALPRAESPPGPDQTDRPTGSVRLHGRLRGATTCRPRVEQTRRARHRLPTTHARQLHGAASGYCQRCEHVPRRSPRMADAPEHEITDPPDRRRDPRGARLQGVGRGEGDPRRPVRPRPPRPRCERELPERRDGRPRAAADQLEAAMAEFTVIVRAGRLGW